MGSNDIPPPHVPSTYHATCKLLLGSGALGYTLCYMLMTRQSLRDRTYSMPLFSLALNFAWETIFSLYVAESRPEKATFGIWMVLDLGLIYAVVKYGEREWRHAPVVGRHIGKILVGCVVWWCVAIWAFARWWISENVRPKAGKWYMGVEGIDTTELGWWAAILAQVVLSVSSLAMIIVRGSSVGASYGIWWSRFLGSAGGLNAYYGYCWWVWPEAHSYFMEPLSVFLWVTWMVADLGYLGVLWDVKRREQEWRVKMGGRSGRTSKDFPRSVYQSEDLSAKDS